VPNLPNGVPLKLPAVGDIVQVAFPTKAWLCAAIVTRRPSLNDPQGRVSVAVLNPNIPFAKVQFRENIPHTAFGSGDEAVWAWRP
jgi:hypothetical protein